MYSDKTKLERLMDMFYILVRHPDGISAADIANKLDVNLRYVHRDRKSLESLIGPIYTEKGKWKFDPQGFLPPVRFNLLEAMTVFMAARLLLGYSNTYNPSIASAFEKLSLIAPATLRNEIRRTLEWMRMQKTDERFYYNLEMLSRAWIERRKAIIQYLTPGNIKPRERIIEPYFIQPASVAHGTYVIAYCHLKKEVLMFKVERIQGIRILDEHYTIPDHFDANKYFGAAFGVSVHGKTENIKLKFNPVIGYIAKETVWHHSQETQMKPDGSAIITFRVPITTELETFILGWGEKVEVMGPASLRNKIANTAQAIAKAYNKTIT